MEQALNTEKCGSLLSAKIRIVYILFYSYAKDQLQAETGIISI